MIWQLVILQLVTFGILVFLLRQFLYRQVTQSQDRLEQLVQENRKREQELSVKREEMDKNLKAQMDEHNNEISKLKTAADLDAQKMQEDILAKAEKEGQRIVVDAEAQKERIRSNLVAEMEEKALSLASDIIACVFTDRIAKGIHYQLADELIEEIEKADGQGLQLDADKVEVNVPYALSKAQMQKLEKVFSSKMGRAIEVKQTIDQNLMTGMVVRLGNSVLDGSLKNKLKGAMAHVRGSLSR